MAATPLTVPAARARRLIAALTLTALSLVGTVVAAPAAYADDLPFDFAPEPTIDGLGLIGETLTALPSEWDPEPEFSYQWLRGDEPIEDATNVEYIIGIDDVETDLTVEVTGTRDGYVPTARTSEPLTVGLREFTTAPSPFISGDTELGDTLIGDTGTWEPAAVLVRQWLRNGAPIPGAQESNYTIVEADLGTTLTLSLTGTLPGYASVPKVSNSLAIPLGEFSWAPPPTIGGVTQVGGILIAQPGAWDPEATFTYQWRRNGFAIDGATAVEYQATAADALQAISVAVTGSHPGYEDLTKTSNAVFIELGEFGQAPAPTIGGVTQVGGILIAQPGAWDPEATFTYQWRRNGFAIDGATAVEYQATAADALQAISVAVTGSHPGYEDLTKTSNAVFIELGEFAEAPLPLISGGTTLGATLTADPGAWVPTPDDIAFQWYRDAAPIDGAEASTYQVADADLGSSLTVTVTASLEGYEPESRTSAGYAIPLGVFDLALRPIITGDALIGEELTAETDHWEPTDTSFTYEWFRNGTAISGATDSTYTVTDDDIDPGESKTIMVVVTATRGGYAPATRISESRTIGLRDFDDSLRPIITGDALIGATLTADTDHWAPTDTSFTYKWFRDGMEVPGETGATYTVTEDDIGPVEPTTITVLVTATRVGYVTRTRESEGRTIGLRDFDDSLRPIITGDTLIGATLTADTDHWAPADTSFTYKWFRDGTEVPGETDPEYTVSEEDFDANNVPSSITVEVTATRVGYVTRARESEGRTIGLRDFDEPLRPIITGDTLIGATLTADTETWDPAPTGATHTWFRDGTVVPGETSPEYTVSEEDFDANNVPSSITVEVTATRIGYEPATRVSEPATIELRMFTTVPKPTINAAGIDKLFANPLIWHPSHDADPEYSYQWFRNGVAIPDAEFDTYSLTLSDRGTDLTVAVTGSRTGYSTATTEVSSPWSIALLDYAQWPGPTISGPAAVGKTLTATVGAWVPVPTSQTYQWRRGTTDIPGATSKNYTLTQADVGALLRVEVTSYRLGYGERVQLSDSIGPIALGAFTAATPKISGTPKRGNTLSVTRGAWTPAPANQSVVWRRDGVAIVGANADTYTITDADLGATLTVRVTGSLAGYSTANPTSAGLYVPAVYSTSPAPKIVGKNTSGSTLSVNLGTWTPKPSSFKYQWYKGGKAIKGATKATYKVTTKDRGSSFTVKVTSSRSKFPAVTKTSAKFAIPKVFTKAPAPKVTGGNKAGATLTAKVAAWSPSATRKFQWHRNGVAIKGATKSKYKLVAADRGTKITVKVTGTKGGYLTTTKTSAAKTIPRVFAAAPKPLIVGSNTAGSTLSVNRGAWNPAPSFKHQWFRNGKAIKGATKATYKVTTKDRGTKISVKVTASKSGYLPSTKASAAKAIPKIFTKAPTPTITGGTTVGAKLTAKPGTWSPSATRTYQWFRAGLAIAGATKSTYTLVEEDLGAWITVKVTGAKSGYLTTTKTSAAKTIPQVLP